METKEKKTKDAIVSMKLSKIRFDDELVDMRKVNSSLVSRYRKAMRHNGVSSFPHIFLDKKTKKIVSGNNRYTAMVKEFGEDYSVSVILRSYKDRAELIEHAIIENTKFGKQLEGFEAKRFRKKLWELNVTEEKIARLFDMAVRSVRKEIGGYVVVGTKPKFVPKKFPVKDSTSIMDEIKKNLQEHEPTKRSIPSSVDTMTQEQWEEHVEKDLGIKLPQLAKQIIRHVKAGFVETSYIPVLKELKDTLDDFFARLPV